MSTYQKVIILFPLFCFFFVTVYGCGPAVILKEPPGPKVETKPPKPFPKAVWIDGHWKWSPAANDFVWVSGHWVKQKPGKKWVAGHWERTPKGWKWVKGRWR